MAEVIDDLRFLEPHLPSLFQVLHRCEVHATSGPRMRARFE